MEGHFLFEADGDCVEEGEHREDSYKHGVVDDRWISRDGSINDVTSDSHDDQGEQELSNIS